MEQDEVAMEQEEAAMEQEEAAMEQEEAAMEQEEAAIEQEVLTMEQEVVAMEQEEEVMENLLKKGNKVGIRGGEEPVILTPRTVQQQPINSRLMIERNCSNFKLHWRKIGRSSRNQQ